MCQNVDSKHTKNIKSNTTHRNRIGKFIESPIVYIKYWADYYSQKLNWFLEAVYILRKF